MVKKSLKTIFTICIILFANINFAAAVSENDGAAFITKAEFDSLKNTFQSELDKYNRNIDAKLEAAINAYISGVKNEKETKLDNKYVLIDPTWMKNKRFNRSKKGTKYTLYISFVEVDLTADGYCSFMIEGTGESWYVVKPMTYNESDQEYLYRIGKKRIGKFDNQWSLQDFVKSDYSATLVGGAGGGRGGSIGANNRLLFGTTTTFRKGSNLYFSTWYDVWPIEVWSVNTSTVTKSTYLDNIGGSAGNGEDIAISAVASDIIEDDSSLFYLAGGSLTNDIMYCINTAEVSLLGDSFVTASSDHGSTRQYRKNDAGTAMQETINWQFRDYGDYRSDYAGGISVEVYRHKITEVNSTSLLNEKITQNIGEMAYYYSGCPLFTATNNGKVSFKIKFKNTIGARTKWALSSDQFANENNPGNCGDIQNCSETVFLANNNDEIEVSFDVKKDKTYWIKCEPESGYSSIEFDGDIMQKSGE